MERQILKFSLNEHVIKLKIQNSSL